MGGGGRGGKRRREKKFPLLLPCLDLQPPPPSPPPPLRDCVSLPLVPWGEEKKEGSSISFLQPPPPPFCIVCASLASRRVTRSLNRKTFFILFFSGVLPHPFALLHLSFLLRPRPFFSKTTDTEVGRSVACSGATDDDALRAVFAPPSHTSLSCNLFLASVFDGVEVSAGGTDPDGAGLEGRNSTK